MKTLSGRPLIVAIVGESASGKSRISDYIGKRYQVPLITSLTDRAKRPKEIEDERNGVILNHLFVTPEEFDAIPPADMIAYTKFGDYRYCCRKEDVNPVNTYVIDETGLEMLLQKYALDYDIVSVRIQCNLSQRARRIAVDGENVIKRMSRDIGKFNLPIDWYDFIINTDDGEELAKRSVDRLMSELLLEFTDCNAMGDETVEY